MLSAKWIFLSVTTFFCSNSLLAKICIVDSFKEIPPTIGDVDASVMILTDLNEILLVPKDPLLRTKEFEEKLESYHLGLGDKKFAAIRSKAMQAQVMKVVAEEMPGYLMQLQICGATVIVFTSLKPGPYGTISDLLDWRLLHLANAGYKFSSQIKSLERWRLEDLQSHYPFEGREASRHPEFRNGLLAAAGFDKGDIFARLLASFESFPFSKVIFIDNRLDWVDSVGRATEAAGLAYLGICYQERALALELDLDLDNLQKKFDALVTEGHWPDA